MSTLLLSTDLMIASWVRGAASRGGYALGVASSGEALVALAGESETKLVLVDLGCPGIELAELVGGLKSLPAAPAVIAFGPHVQEARLAAAAEAGCDRVLARGQLHAQIDQLLAQYAAAGS